VSDGELPRENARRAADMDARWYVAPVVCVAQEWSFCSGASGSACRWEAEGLRGSAWQARGLGTDLLLVAGWRCRFERMLPEGFLNAPGAWGSDALVDRQRLL
jgi:hypothetical protein